MSSDLVKLGNSWLEKCHNGISSEQAEALFRDIRDAGYSDIADEVKAQFESYTRRISAIQKDIHDLDTKLPPWEKRFDKVKSNIEDMKNSLKASPNVFEFMNEMRGKHYHDIFEFVKPWVSYITDEGLKGKLARMFRNPPEEIKLLRKGFVDRIENGRVDSYFILESGFLGQYVLFYQELETMQKEVVDLMRDLSLLKNTRIAKVHELENMSQPDTVLRKAIKDSVEERVITEKPEVNLGMKL